MTTAPASVWPDRDDTALLIVDMQERLLAAMPEKPAKRMLRNTKILIETAQSFGNFLIVST